MVGDRRQGYALFAAMAVLLVVAFAAVYAAERAGNPLHAAFADPAMGNMEGKEVRFGVVGSALWAVTTTAASNGSVNAMHDSLTPLGGLITMLNIQLGEIIYGGVGVGLTGMLLFVVLTVFLAGLMVGRTPEYLGKKIEAREIKLAALTLLIMPIARARPLGARHRRGRGANERAGCWAAWLVRADLCLHLSDRQ